MCSGLFARTSIICVLFIILMFAAAATQQTAYYMNDHNTKFCNFVVPYRGRTNSL